MVEQFSTDGLTIAPGVVETILMQAVLQVDGVARVGSPKPIEGLFGSSKRNNATQAVVLTAEDGKIMVSVHICVHFGYRLQEVAEQVRYAVADTLGGQIGVTTSAVDVFVDGIVFPE
ncbi:MAG: Asp23/Gls24 family envelope stress response protein [Coriobacteriia bacterium]|nr:Asp23/Gls24 family envelope stress response protein [Coriobacteriia bacterium]